MGRTTLAMTIFSRNQDSTCILYNESNVSANRHNKLIFLPFIFATCQKNSQIIWTCTLLLLNNFNATVTVTTTSRTTTTTTTPTTLHSYYYYYPATLPPPLHFWFLSNHPISLDYIPA